MTQRYEQTSGDRQHARIMDALTRPITLTPDEYTNARLYPPTPLDPDNVMIMADEYGLRGPRDHETGRLLIDPVPTSFRDFALGEVNIWISALGSLELPTPLLALIEQEMVAQINNRAEHSKQSMDRLRGAMMLRPPQDDSIYDIVLRARAGGATPEELLRLIKEYPEMISIEVTNAPLPIGRLSVDPVRAALEMSRDLRDTFPDAYITLGSETPRSVTRSRLVPGIEVIKRVIAEARSTDSYTELVMKTPEFNYNEACLRLGVTTYFRAHDRRDREGYSSEDAATLEQLAEGARQHIGALAELASNN